MTEKKNNPFPYSDSNKRYYTYDYYLRQTYGGKCAKVMLNGGFTCPNIDGTCGYGGCIYCSEKGSGDFAGDAGKSLTEQYREQTEKVLKKWDTHRFIPYLQAHTNTYAPVERLREIYKEILSFPETVGFHIATRADCLPPETVRLLAEIAEKTDLTIELGLQSVKEETAKRINRCHSFATFLDGYGRLREASDKIRVAVHLINGLPGEDKDDMLYSAAVVAGLRPEEIKIHLLHVLEGTELARWYREGRYRTMEREEYIDVVVSQLELLPPETVIGRLTGDGPSELLLSPLWSLKKVTVLNDIDKAQAARDSYQGKQYVK